MGAVYLARERALDRLVAIKVLQPESTDADSVERFRREARTAAKLTHPNIVPLHSFGEAGGMMYFVMGFVQGEPLSARLKRRGRLDPDEVRELLATVADALHYAHSHGVVHRDIKPDNILIEDETGKPVLTDFGIAKSASGAGATLTQLGTTLGTPLYMSPEQAAGDRAIDHRSDLYSLGVVGYQLLAGRCPFEADSARELLVQHITKDPLPLRSLAPSAPADLIDAISALLAKDPARRTSDARTLSHALRAGSGGEEQLPEELEDFITEGRAASGMVAASLYAGYNCALWGNGLWAGAFSLLAGVFALLPPISRHVRKLQRYSWRTLLPMLLRKPRLWIGWWPKSLRAPDDLWDRLPVPLRRVLEAYGPFLGTAALVLPLVARTLFEPTWDLIRLIALVVAPTAVTLSLFFWRVLQLERWARRIGLRQADISQLMSPHVSTPFWKKPHIQKLLLPSGENPDAAPRRLPDTPAGIVDALIAAAGELDGPERQLARDAAAAGREVHEAIQKLDRQIETLARDADPAEHQRLEEKVKALRAVTDAESDAQRRMRNLLEQQLELTRGLAGQLDAIRDRRARLGELLKTLWLQIANLGAQQHDTAFDGSAITGRIRTITDDARRYLEAYTETSKLLE
jgi:hypothetical protein